MLLAHLSDPHLSTGALMGGPAAGLHAALGRVVGPDPAPDAVIITGDLADHGQAQAYEQLRELLAPVAVPTYLATGNHDDPDAVLAAFAGTVHLGGGGALHYAVDLPGARLIVLNSWLRGSGAGRIGQEQLAWLDATLSRRPETPTVLAFHHPPVAVGIPFLDAIGLLDADALAGVVAGHRQVVRVLCGHVHRAVTASFAGTLMTTAPSTYRQSALDLCPLDQARMGYLEEPVNVLLHQLSPATGGSCITHLVPVTGASAAQYPIAPR